MDLSVLDDSSAALAIQIQLEDLESLINSSKGKDRQDDDLDSEPAISAYKAQLESLRTLVSDRRMCRSIAQAVVSDGDLIHGEQKIEKQAARVPCLDTRRGGREDSPRPKTDLDEEILRKMEALYVVSPTPNMEGDLPESSSWAAARSRAAAPKLATCTSCGDAHKFYDMARCPCSHEYCRACFAQLFEASMTDDSLYPPRCCRQEIPLEPNRLFLPANLAPAFLAKKSEMDDPKRIHCHEATCSAFIPSKLIEGDEVCCPECHVVTCVICRGPAHVGDCPQDTDTQELLKVAAQNGWQRCNSCHRIVELKHGCNHMTCRCGAQFCYTCGARWKTCLCSQWDEPRLIA